MKDSSKSDYNWIASATELVRVCNEPNFPQEYAKGIKIAILNCFSHLAKMEEYPSNEEPTDNDAVYSCYNSLSSSDEDSAVAKQKYLIAIIESITKYYHFEFPSHTGPIYKKTCKEWEKSKFDEWSSKEAIDFKQLIKDLEIDFDKTIKAAEEEGIFKKEDDEYWEKEREFMSNMFKELTKSLDFK